MRNTVKIFLQSAEFVPEFGYLELACLQDVTFSSKILPPPYVSQCYQMDVEKQHYPPKFPSKFNNL
jgi:hypothetical protein